jgi:hypothetical protein
VPLDPRSRAAVETAERLAEGLATEQERAAAEEDAQPHLMRHEFGESLWLAAAAYHAVGPGAGMAASYASINVSSAAMVTALSGPLPRMDSGRLLAEGPSAVGRPQADLLREIFGNPFRPPALDPAWSAWNDGAIAKMAQAIYEAKAFDRLPVLGDALEEAGCADAALLGHCRGPEPHVPGCWVLDLLLGKS